MDKVNCHSQDIDGKLNAVTNWNITAQNKEKVVKFIKEYQLGKITGKIGTNPQGSSLRTLYFLKVGLENIKGETKADIEDFLERLLKDKIKSYNPRTKQYSGSAYVVKSKRDIINFLKLFLCWKNPEKSAVYKQVLELKIAKKFNDIETLNEDEIEKLMKEDIPSDKKYLLSILASGGLRAEEFHNIRYSDFEMPKGKDMFVKLTIRNQFSKTKGRKIQLFDKWVLPAVKQYLAERLEEGIKPNDIIYKITYYSNKKWLNRFGKRVINKPIGYHIFRHTSATRLCSKMNRQQLCIYFGWRFNSPMPDVYIERSGVDMVDVESKFANTNFEEQQSEIKDLKEQFEKFKTLLVQNAIGKTQISKEERDKVKKHIEMVLENG